MPLELAGCQALLLAEVADRRCRRRDVAQTYAPALRSSERDAIDWPAVNRATMARWSASALDWIKSQAWSGKCLIPTHTHSHPSSQE